jgi:hypothetical protein
VSGRPAFQELVFEGGYSEQDEYEAFSGGYRSHVYAKLENGATYRLTFYDPIRLKQMLDDETAFGTPFLADPGLIVLHDVTRENMERAARELTATDFYDWLRPID